MLNIAIPVQYLGFTLLSFVYALVRMPFFIRWLKALKLGQVIREDGPKSHLTKSGTPCLGGVVIFEALWPILILSSILGLVIIDPVIMWCIGVFALFLLLGLADDLTKLYYKKGISIKKKLIIQLFIAGVLAYLYPLKHMVHIPGVVDIDLGMYMPCWIMLVLVSTSNAVNLSDGLDGLVALPLCLIFLAMAVLCAVFANNVSILWLCAILCGGLLGFLYYNSYPAQIFMGDAGSLGLGGILGAVAISIQQEIALILMAGLFVIETVSVAIQIISFKLTGRRVFKMAPIHHHFEVAGWPEPKVILRFWLLSLWLTLFGFLWAMQG